MKLSHLTIFFAVLAAAFLPGTAHAQSCYPFYCDIGGVYVQGEMIGYARIVDYVGYGETGLEADASIHDPDGNTVASGSDYEPSLEAEAEVVGWPDSQYPYGTYDVQGGYWYYLEDYDGSWLESLYSSGIDVPQPQPPPPQINPSSCPGPWSAGQQYGISITGSGFTGQSVWIYGSGLDWYDLSVTSDSLIQGQAYVSSGIGGTTYVYLNVGSVAACTVAPVSASPPPPELTLQRISLMEVLATGSPSGGGFAINITPGNGGSPVGLSLTSNITAQSDDFTLVDPPSSGAPSPGTLSAVKVKYTLPSGASTSDSFNVPTFGMSCYKNSLELDFMNAAGQCSNGLSQPNPPNITGTFCSAFLSDVMMQGSGFSANGTAIQYDTNTQTYYVPQDNTPTGADGPLIAGQTVARNTSTIPRNQGWTVSVDGVGANLRATDKGSPNRITAYRLDQFMGAGNSACAGYPNLMGVAACTPGGAACPGSAIQ
jgi:hypothetical protein